MRTYFNLVDLKVIHYYTGFVTLITAGLLVIPMITALLFSEWPMFVDLFLTLNVALLTALIFMSIGRKAKMTARIQWKHGLIISALSWFILMMISALPYFLSGHYISYLDATFDVMSGFTTTGLTLSMDMDHMPMSLNMWRHIITFVGGQGMVVLALSFLFQQTHGAYKIYVGEAKDVELVPSVKGTARIIWMISLAYLFVGTIALWINGVMIGLSPVNAFFHGLFIFASSWSTGGFAPMSQNMLFYHSFSYELVTILFMILGSFNFGLHYAILKGNRKELYKNIELQSFFVTLVGSGIFLTLWLKKEGLYSNVEMIFRKGIYHLLSAHTTTGFGSVYAKQFASDWGEFGILILIVTMLIGGSACSTAGGIKGLRIGILVKALMAEIRKILRSERRINIEKYHHIKDNVLDDATIKASAIITLCYVVLFTVGTAIGCFYGYPLIQSAFESASTAGNVGLSIGITNAAMPTGLKIYYIIAMYLGRLEFLSVFALIGFMIGGIKSIWKRN